MFLDICLKKTENKRKRGRGCPIFLKKNNKLDSSVTLSFHHFCQLHICKYTKANLAVFTPHQSCIVGYARQKVAAVIIQTPNARVRQNFCCRIFFVFFCLISDLSIPLFHSKTWCHWRSTNAWSSLVEGDEQLGRPNIQTTMELCHACVAQIFCV